MSRMLYHIQYVVESVVWGCHALLPRHSKWDKLWNQKIHWICLLSWAPVHIEQQLPYPKWWGKRWKTWAASMSVRFDIRHSQVTNLCASATRVFTTLAGSLETYHCYYSFRFCFHDIHGHFRTMGTMGTMRTLAYATQGTYPAGQLSAPVLHGVAKASSCLDDNIHRSICSIPTSCCFTKQNSRW